jgi:SulP family sulfate permease
MSPSPPIDLRADRVAGLTTAAVVIPKAMAFATIAGLPLEVGLYTALVPLVVDAAVGTSRSLAVWKPTRFVIDGHGSRRGQAVIIRHS